MVRFHGCAATVKSENYVEKFDLPSRNYIRPSRETKEGFFYCYERQKVAYNRDSFPWSNKCWIYINTEFIAIISKKYTRKYNFCYQSFFKGLSLLSRRKRKKCIDTS